MWSYGPQPCLTQWNYKPRWVGPPKTNGLWWRVWTKHGPLQKGMANHLSILALRTPWTVRKGQEATVRTGHGTTDWFQIGKGVHQGCMLSLCLFNLHAGLDEVQAGIKIARRNINNLWYTGDTTLVAEREELKSLLKVRQESEKAGWKLNNEKTDHGIQSHHFMANRWGSNGNRGCFEFQNHCRWWLHPWNQKMLASWEESYDQHRQHIIKQRHYFANKVLSSQSYSFSSSNVWMWELDCKERWVLKNRCFWTVVLEKTPESPLDSKEIQPVHPKGDQSWIFTGRTDAEAKTPNTLATWCEELTHQKRPWCWERLKVGGEGDNRGWDGWMASPAPWTWVWASSRSWWWTGRSGVLPPTGSKRDTTEWLNWLI